MAADGAGGRTKTKPHAVVIPYPLQGHVIPAAHLALRLASRGFTVTFVNTESVHQQTARALGVDRRGCNIFAGARGSEDVQYELVSDGFPLGFDRSLNHDQFMEGVLHVLPAHVEELLRRVVLDPASTCLVADTFFVWPATLARALGVPYVSFWTEPALIFALYYHMDLLTMHGHFNCKDAETDVAAAEYDYAPDEQPVDDLSLLPEQPDDGVQEPDTTSGAYYQEGPDGTYYWTEPADQE